MIRKYAEIFCWKNVSSFCSAKATHIFSAKNIRILYIESAKTVNEMTLNELVKLTTLWTTGPWFGADMKIIFLALIVLSKTVASESNLFFIFYYFSEKIRQHFIWIICLFPLKNTTKKTIKMLSAAVVIGILTLILGLLVPDIIPFLCKQWRSRSVGFLISQLIWICTVCHSVCEFLPTT